MNHKPAVVVLSLVLPLTSGVAQERPAAGQGPFLSVSLAGPKVIRRSILPTNIGALFGGPETRPMWGTVNRFVRTMFEELEDSADVNRAWGSVQQRMLGYGGTIELKLYLDRREKQGGRVKYDVAGHMLLSPDGVTNLEKLRADFRRLFVAAAREEPKKEMIEGEDLVCEYFGRPGDEGISLPMRYRKNHVVVFFGNRIDKAIWQGLRRLDKSWPQRNANPAKPTRASRELLSVELDWRQAGQLLVDEYRRRPDEGRIVRRFFGAETWDKLRFRARTVGPHLQFELRADFTPGDRGVLASLLPDIQGLPSLVHRVPANDLRGFVAAHVRWDVFYSTILAAVSRAGRANRPLLAQIKAEANREVGFDVDADLLAHVGTEVLLLSELSTPDLAPGVRLQDGDGLCFVFRIKDDVAFANTFRKILTMNRRRMPQPIQRGGVEVHPVRIISRSDHLARTDGHFFYSIGERGLTALTAYLGRPARPAGETGKPTLPEWLRRVQNQAPPGFNLAGSLPLRFFGEPMGNEVLWEIWREMGMRRKSRKTLREDVNKLLPILAKYRLDQWILLGGYERRRGGGGRARIRLVW